MNEHNILGSILAGGKSKRMGEDKLFVKLNNKTLIEHTINKVRKHFKKLIIVTNNDNEFFKKNNYTIVKDCITGQLGPLVGILTTMKWAKENYPNCSWVATFPCDTPFFPESIISKFIEESKKKESLILCASSHGRKHNIFGLWSLDLYDKLYNDLVNNKVRKVQDWTKVNNIKNLEFKFKDYDPFFNINTVEDLEIAKKLSLKLNK
tara:strand:+ start:24 stop:644 length:621 start_codon:yes stop_codon:yes gene_type:complete